MILPKIKIFSDGAQLQTLLAMAKDPLIEGFTTNPSLMKAAGIRDYRAFCQSVLAEIQDKPISFEVFADEFSEMQDQAREIASWGANVYVKIPVMNSQGTPSYDVIQTLSHSGVQVNVTAVFTLEQVYNVCQSLKGGAPSLLSVLAGRIADTGRNPFPLMEAAATLCQATDPNIELLWAATREAYNVVQAAMCGAQIITAPPEIIKKIQFFGKDLVTATLETVRTFKADSEAAGFQLECTPRQ